MDYRTASSRVSVISMITNLLLAAFKFAAGFLGHSSAMISDAIHSSSDILGSLIVLIGVNAAEKTADEDHPYGHERLESVASIFLAVLLFLAAFTVGRSAIETIRAGSEQSVGKPGLIALVAAIVSIVVKEALFHYTMHQARILDSEALRAEAWHNRSDSLSSIGALVGIAGARMGLPVLDPIAGLVICVFIFKAGIDVFRESIEKLTDHRCDPMLEKQIRDCVACFDEVKNIDVLRTREFGRRVYIDMELSMPGQHTLAATHQTAEEIHDKLETDFPKIKHVMIHVNPC